MPFLFWRKKKISCNKTNDQKIVKSVRIKIPAKLMISGEHSVIYNSKAVTCAVNIFLNIEIKKITKSVIIINDGKDCRKVYLKDLSIEHKNSDVILEIIRRFFDKAKLPLCGMKITIKNSIPIGCGLGSSSSLVAGIVFGMNELFGGKKSVSELINAATSIENIFHGKSSGVDIQTVVKGGVLYVNHNSVNKIAHQIDEIWIVNTGCPSFSTKNVVMNVFDNFASHDELWREMGEITSDIAEIMLSKEKVFKKIAHNESCLEKIGIVKSNVKKFIDDLKSNGIYGKVCGAGTIAKREKNGGNGIVGIFQKLSKEQEKYLFLMCKKNKFSVKKIYISNAGLIISSK